MEQKYKLLLLFLFFLVSCNLTKKNKNIYVLAVEKEEITSSTKINFIEYMLIDSIVINENIPFFGKKQEILPYLSSIDSINKQGYDCGSNFEIASQILYFGKSELETNEETYIFRKIFFSNSFLNKIYYKKIVLDENYTLKKFSQDFPFSYSRRHLTEKETELEIHVSTNAQMDFDLLWRFHFINGKLYSIWYFIPC